MEDYKIYPICTGMFTHAEKSNFSYQKNPGEKIKAPVLAYLIKGDNSCILVDTGCSDAEWAAKYHHPIIQTDEMKLDNALQALGINPGDIKTVINTHLHWDHSFNNNLFSNAKIYVQKRELEFARNPLPTQYIYYESPQINMIPRWEEAADRIEVIDGDYCLQEGIDLLLTPGHTPGFQSVLVTTSRGRYMIASDCVGLIENWEEKQTYGLPTPSGIHIDLNEYYNTFQKMLPLTDYILPGHDMRVLEHKYYPFD